MNAEPQNSVMLGPGIRNLCDKLIKELNSTIIKTAENKKDVNDKIKDFKFLFKTNFYQYIKPIPKILKCYKNLSKDDKAIQALNVFYITFERIINELDFINKLSELYIFPKFDLNNTLDLIFDGCTYNLREELIKSSLFNLIASKNLYDNNDIGFLIKNDLNNVDYNDNSNNTNANVLLDKENSITKGIIEKLKNKIDEFNSYILLNKEGFDESNFELYLDDDHICVKVYDNFLIKFIPVQKKINNNIYFFLPVEITYNNEVINLNDKEEIFIDKNKCLSKSDLQFFIDKFKPKYLNPTKKKKKIEIDIEIQKFTKDDFVEKCLLFKDFTKTLFNDKFENLKVKISDYIKKYDMPITIEDSSDSGMDIDNKEETDNNICELTIYYNFAIYMKRKNEFYIKLIYNKNYPTIIKVVFSHIKIGNENSLNNDVILYIEQVEKKILFDLKWIKNEIRETYEGYKIILTNWIYKKLLYLYPLYYNFRFIKRGLSIFFELKLSSNKNFSKSIFSLYINDLGRLTYNNLITTKIICDDFKEINSMIINFLKNEDNENEQNDIILKFNQYINHIILEKLFIISGIKIKVIELNNETNQLVLHLYNSYYTDCNISIYFAIKCQIFIKYRIEEKDNNNNNIHKKAPDESSNIYFACIHINQIKLISLNNKDHNKKIIIDCFDKNMSNLVEFNKFFISYSKMINDLNNKYQLFMFYAYDILKLAEKPESVFELNGPVEITNIFNNQNKEEECFELTDEKHYMNLFKKDYKDNLQKYFYKIKINKENNIFQLYLKPEVFKKKYFQKILKYQMENYSIMFQYYIFGYDYKEDFISIIILSKLKIGYINIIEIVFESFIPRIISYMVKIFNLIDYLAKNEPMPLMIACPLFLTLEINYNDIYHKINFKKHINFKIIDKDKDKSFSPDGNYNTIFIHCVKEFGNELMTSKYDYNDKQYFLNISKLFYLNYSIYELFINEYKFKYSLLIYPYNHFEQNIKYNIYFINKDFNVLELMAVNNNISLTTQIRKDNSLFLEFRDNSHLEINDNNNQHKRSNCTRFFEKMRNIKFQYNIKGPNENNDKVIIEINDTNKNEISLIEKLRQIVNIFVDLSKE